MSNHPARPAGFSRRRFLAGSGTVGALAALGGLSALSGCSDDDDDQDVSTGGSTTSGAPASGEAIKVAVMLPSSGPYAPLGEMQTKGIKLALGDRVGDRPIEVMSIEEPVLSPQDAIARAKGAADDGAHMLIGIISGASALAIRDVVHDAKLPTLITNAVTRAVTGSRRSPYLYRASTTGYQAGVNFGPWLYENVGKTMVTAAPDYASGRELIEYPARFFTKAGGEVKGQYWPALGASDYASVLTEMGSTDADLAYCFFAGTDAVRFVTQFDEFELHDKLELTGLTLVDDLTLDAQKEAALGTVLLGGWNRRLDNKANKAFLADFDDAYGEAPNSYAVAGYTGGTVLRMAIEAVGGDVEDADGFTAAMAGVTFTTPSGSPLRFDPDTHNAISKQTVERVTELDDGSLGFERIAELGEAVDPGDDVEP